MKKVKVKAEVKTKDKQLRENSTYRMVAVLALILISKSNFPNLYGNALLFIAIAIILIITIWNLRIPGIDKFERAMEMFQLIFCATAIMMIVIDVIRN